MDLFKKYITKSTQETENLGAKTADYLKLFRKGAYPIICLYGSLGVGKTIFVRGFLHNIGIKGRILSPTYIFLRQYKNFLNESVYHYDLYRLKDPSDLENLGYFEIFSLPKFYILIEWADKMGDYLPKNRLDIIFEHIDNKYRQITINYMGNI